MILKRRIDYPRRRPVPGKGETEESLSFARRFADSVVNSLEKAWSGVENEWRETQEMGQAFFKVLEHKLRLKERSEPPSKEEVKKALEQLADVGRFSLFASVSILPGGGVSLIGLEILARKLGVKNFSLVPSSFRKMKGSRRNNRGMNDEF